MKRVLKGLCLLASDAMIALLRASAWLLGPLRIGRLLRTVSIPRLQEHRARSSLTILGVALGVAVLVAVSIVSDSVMNGVTATVDSIAGRADLQLSTASSGFDEALLERIRAVPGVYRATPVVQQTATIRNPGARGERLLVLGVDLLGTEDGYFREYNSRELAGIRKDALTFLNSTSNILVSRQIAERFGLHLHDTLKLGTDRGVQEFDVWGFIDGEGLGRAFGGAVAVMYYPSMQEAFGRGHHIDHVDVAVTPGSAPSAVAERLQTALGGGFNIDRPLMRGERVSNMLAAVRTSLLLASLIALLAGGFLVFNTMAISFVQRRREFATLQALGTTRLQLLRLLILEGALIGIVGSLLGVAFGVGLSRALLELTASVLAKVYVQQAITEVYIRWPVLAIGFGLGVVATIIAAAVPAAGVASTRVAQTLKSASIVTVAQPSLKPNLADAAAVALLVAGYFLMRLPPYGHLPLGALAACFCVLSAGRALLPRVIQGTHALISAVIGLRLGMHARLANDNLPRDIGRTAATATGLMAGAALTVGFGTFGTSFVNSLNMWSAQSVPGDLFVTSGAAITGLSSRNIPLAPQLGDELARLPGVENVQKLRLADYDYQSFPVKITSLDTRLFQRYSRSEFVEGDAKDAEQLLQGKIGVSENFSHRFHVHKGDTLYLSGKRGARPFEVAVVMVDYSSDIGTVTLDREFYREHWGDDRVDTFELHLATGTDREATRRLINERFGDKYDLFVLTNAEFRAEMVDAADGIFSLMRMLELVMLVVATLGIINSLFASVLDRVREIGVLRALGMRRAHTSQVIVIEAALVGLVGLVAGALTGIGLGYVIVTHVTAVQTGWHFPYQPPWLRLAQIAAIVLPVAAAAGWYPAKQAAGLVVRDALNYE